MSCSLDHHMVPELAEARASIDAVYQAAQVPLIAHLDLTYRCDLDCQHCYLDDKRWPELTTDEWRQLLRQLREAGTLYLMWSGGELLVRPDFMELLALAGDLGFVNRLKTHAGNVTPDIAQGFHAARVEKVDVSVYSLRPEVHDRVTRRPGSLVATLRGMRHIRDVGIPCTAVVVVMPETIDEVEQLWRQLRSEGFEVRLHDHVFRDHSASGELDVHDLSEAERVRLGVLRYRLNPRPKAQTMDLGREPTPCRAGRTAAYIAPDGSVWPCITWPMSLGNLREASFLEIWQGSAKRQEILAWTNSDRKTCLSCAGSNYCGYCAGEAYKLTGDWRHAPTSFHAQARARMLGHEASGQVQFTDAEWASVPAGGERPDRPEHFVFPIHHKQRGDGRRVR